MAEEDQRKMHGRYMDEEKNKIKNNNLGIVFINDTPFVNIWYQQTNYKINRTTNPEKNIMPLVYIFDMSQHIHA